MFISFPIGKIRNKNVVDNFPPNTLTKKKIPDEHQQLAHFGIILLWVFQWMQPGCRDSHHHIFKAWFFPKITHGLTGLPCLKFGLGVGGLWVALFVIGLYCNHRPVWEWLRMPGWLRIQPVLHGDESLILFPDSELEWWMRMLHGLDRTGSCSGQFFFIDQSFQIDIFILVNG